MISTNEHSVTCPEVRRAENRKKQTSEWWRDPRWAALRDGYLKENKNCVFCGKKANTVHHDNKESYSSQEEYYKPENFTAVCLMCHKEYKRGFVICPKCKTHYIRPHNDMCRSCKGLPPINRSYHDNYPSKKRRAHSCDNRVGQQRCQRNGKVYVCGRSSSKASGCDYFVKKEDKK